MLIVWVRRIRCHECKAFAQEPLPFCPGPYARYTNPLARYVIGLRSEMSIKAVARFTGLHWETVKNIEKDHLKRKYRRIRLKDTTVLGIDEVYLGRTMGFITVVRDLESGAVLHIGKGKGYEALAKFRKRIRKQSQRIKAVCIDMAGAYSAWVKEVLPEADIVYDHFHVIKMMNKRLDELRRRTMKQLDAEQKKQLKNKRWLLLKNIESLSDEAKSDLEHLRGEFDDLGTASAMKEVLRNIYRMAYGITVAKLAFKKWCAMADESDIHCLKQMAKTIRTHWDGVLAYWRHNDITNASQEGFNNKIGWLTRQAYGYHDEQYLHLKIFDLSNLSTVRKL
jgi:transposase